MISDYDVDAEYVAGTLGDMYNVIGSDQGAWDNVTIMWFELVVH